MKYILNTDHRAGHNYEDRFVDMKANNILDAMNEAIEYCEHDDNLYKVEIYEKEKNMYTRQSSSV